MTEDRDFEAVIASANPGRFVKVAIEASAVLPPDARHRFLVSLCRGLLEGGLGYLVLLFEGAFNEGL